MPSMIAFAFASDCPPLPSITERLLLCFRTGGRALCERLGEGCKSLGRSCCRILLDGFLDCPEALRVTAFVAGETGFCFLTKSLRCLTRIVAGCCLDLGFTGREDDRLTLG